jgi:hypothetical protein
MTRKAKTQAEAAHAWLGEPSPAVVAPSSEEGGRVTLSVRICLAGFLLAAPLPVMAQPATPIFVGGGPILNRDMTWAGSEVRNVGVSLSGGVRLGPRIEIGVQVEIPPATTLIATTDYYGGESPPRVIERATSRLRARNRTVAITVARLFPVMTRLQLTTTAGWSSSKRLDDVTTTVQSVDSGAIVDRPDSGPGSNEWGGPVFGAGAIVALTSHIAVVPEMRFIWYPAAENGSAIVRTGIGARWSF